MEVMKEATKVMEVMKVMKVGSSGVTALSDFLPTSLT
jgi:hypothetical protein